MKPLDEIVRSNRSVKPVDETAQRNRSINIEVLEDRRKQLDEIAQ